MAEKRSLLPPNSTPLERRLSAALAGIEDIPLPLRSLRRAETCPPELMTWLAWERSADRWNDGWSEQTKRAALASSFFIHKHKGTIGAIRRVVEPLGYLLDVTEWFDMQPEGRRGTFSMSVGVLDTGIDEQTYLELERLVDDAKRASQHLVALTIVQDIPASLNLSVGAYEGESFTVYPFMPDTVSTALPALYALADHTVETSTTYPFMTDAISAAVPRSHEVHEHTIETFTVYP